MYLSRKMHKKLAREQISESLVVAGVVFSIPIAIFIATLLIEAVEIMGVSIYGATMGIGILEYILLPVVATVGIKYVRKEDFLPKEVMYQEVDTNLVRYFGVMARTYLYTLLWTLLLVIPGIVKTYSYFLVPYIISENPELTGEQAINKSRELMDGNKAELFLLDLSFFWWYVLVGITFGIAGVYVVPYVYTVKTRKALELMYGKDFESKSSGEQTEVSKPKETSDDIEITIIDDELDADEQDSDEITITHVDD